MAFFAGLVDPAAGQHPFVWMGVATALLSFVIAYLSVARNNKRFSKFFAAFMLSQSLWATADTLVLALIHPRAMLVAENISVMAQFMYAVFWLAFVFDFTKATHLFTWQNAALVLALPVSLTLTVWTNPWFHLLYPELEYATSGPLTVFALDKTFIIDFLGFTVMFVYAFLGIAWLVWYSIQAGTRMHRNQGMLVMLTGVIVAVGGTAAYFDIHPYPNAPFTTIVFIIGSIPLFWAFYGHQFLSVVPVARREVVKGMNEALLVVDSDDTVIDTNAKFNDLFMTDDSEMIGSDLTKAFPGNSEFYTEFDERTIGKGEIEHSVDGSREILQVRQSPLFNDRESFVGRVFLFENVTEERERQAKLERQNERLDNFASVVSHDLRNPLSAAMGYTGVVRGQVDDEQHVDTIERNLDRMETMIEEVLEMSRQGAAVEDPEILPVHELAETAWGFVDSDEATLEVKGELLVEADEERLQRAFENLMRNSIDHGSADVTITVGVEDGMVYLEDDGPGIPEDRWDGLFEFGQTYSDDGTGFGLAIVKSIIEAHGWKIDVAEPQLGTGARFEITGVSAVED